jgi:hypothetical protein
LKKIKKNISIILIIDTKVKQNYNIYDIDAESLLDIIESVTIQKKELVDKVIHNIDELVSNLSHIESQTKFKQHKFEK